MNQILLELPAILISCFIIYGYNRVKELSVKRTEAYLKYSSFVKFLILILFIRY